MGTTRYRRRLFRLATHALRYRRSRWGAEARRHAQSLQRILPSLRTYAHGIRASVGTAPEQRNARRRIDRHGGQGHQRITGGSKVQGLARHGDVTCRRRANACTPWHRNTEEGAGTWHRRRPSYGKGLLRRTCGRAVAAGNTRLPRQCGSTRGQQSGAEGYQTPKTLSTGHTIDTPPPATRTAPRTGHAAPTILHAYPTPRPHRLPARESGRPCGHSRSDARSAPPSCPYSTP